MNIRAKVHSNYWIWLGISVPWILVLLLSGHLDKAGEVWSDWSWLIYNANRQQWSYCREILLWDFLPPLAVGWITQFFVTIIWRRVRGSELSSAKL